MSLRSYCRSAALGGATLGCALAGGHALAAPAIPATPMVTAPVSDAHMISLAASMPAAVASSTDQGALNGSAMVQHMQLALARSPARQVALDALVAAQTQPGSPSFHKWLTPATLRSDYGPAPADIAATVQWLQASGLTVNSVSPTGMSIDFSGSAAVVAGAFHTQMHGYQRNGQAHMAPASAPEIPAALAPVVSGVTMSNFFPTPQITRMAPLAASTVAAMKVSHVGTSYTANANGRTYYAVTPSDFATIYDENEAFTGAPAIGAKITGKGQTIVVAERTNIQAADWNSFRSTFGLTGYKGTLSFSHPGGCADPGTTPDEGEAALDAEWSSAAAPDANIIEASCADVGITFGVMTTLQNLVQLGTPAAAISISYGGCEQGNGLTFLQMWSNLIEEGASEGISIFVSSGDSASAGCDPAGATAAKGGLAVNGLASNPYDTAVGGTDFQDTALGQNSRYWSSKNSSSGGSALSYIPEIPWDNSCSNVIIDAYYGSGGPIKSCNNPPKVFRQQNTVGGGGGQSLLYAKPDWQSPSIPGVPNDGVRDLPDISLFAANGIWNHFYLFCMSDKAQGGVPCDYTNTTDFLGSAAGGTSFAAPAFAGITALIAQYQGFRVGNIAPRLYQLAQSQYSNPVLVNSCNASRGNQVSRACVFYDVTKGDNSAPCVSGSPNCFSNANSTKGIGVLSITPNALNAAFPATQAYDLATGLGTVNVTNLIVNYTQY
ncbi:S53 family peptidase [Lichenicoccus sp.]|uniref:S53 family peptidase n=1 Tax=Lichenicoccus sp. TaxID=2781899 RepID=UPI003D10190F